MCPLLLYWNDFQISGGSHIYLVTMNLLVFLGFVPCCSVHSTTPTTDQEDIPAQRTHTCVVWFCCTMFCLHLGSCEIWESLLSDGTAQDMAMDSVVYHF